MKIWFIQKCLVKGFLPSTTGSFFLSFGPIYFHVLKTTYEMHCTIWYHLYKLKSENLHGRVLLLVKLQAKSTYLKSTTPLWMFFAFFKLYKWYQITQRITYYQCCRSFGLALIACFPTANNKIYSFEEIFL